MLEKLNKKQIFLMEETKNEWLDRFYSCKKLDKKLAIKQIKWLYRFSNLKKPKIIFVDSPLAIQYACNLLNNINQIKEQQVKEQIWEKVRKQVRGQIKGQVWGQVGEQVRKQVWEQVREQVEEQIGEQIWEQVEEQIEEQVEGQVREQIREQVWRQINKQVWEQVREQVEKQVGEQVEEQVWRQVKEQVWKQVGEKVRKQIEEQIKEQQVKEQIWEKVRKQVRGQIKEQVWRQVREQVGEQVRKQIGEQKNFFYQFCWYGDVWDYAWVSFYDFFEKIDIVKNKEFTQFKNLLKSNIFTMVQLNQFCVVCGMPEYIKKNNENKLHSLEKSAIKWSDGYELYYLDGINFEKNLWKKIVSKKMSLKDILEIKNIEQRMCALKYNSEKLLEKAKLLDKSKRGNELYLVKGIFSEPAYFLKYVCPSTGRIYVSGIDPQFAKKNKDADMCMAWKHNWSLKQYHKLVFES